MLRIKELRKAANMTQKELADEIGVTQATLSGWESEKYYIDYISMMKLADIFEVSVDYLLGRNSISNNSITTGDINSNTSVIGHHSNITLAADQTPAADEQELLRLFHTLSPTDRARALIHVSDLSEKQQKIISHC